MLLAQQVPDIGDGEFDFSEEEPEPSSSGRARGCPVYVMLPLDTVWTVHRGDRSISVLKKERSLEIALHTLKQAGVEGVMVDVWWGIVERAGPGSYDFSAYKRLFYKVAAAGLKVQAVMSFHAAGGNVGDTCKIPLPRWVLEIGEQNKEIYYTDKSGYRNRECLSLGCDEVPIFWGRTPVQTYTDFIDAFCNNFQHLFGGLGLGGACHARTSARRACHAGRRHAAMRARATQHAARVPPAPACAPVYACVRVCRTRGVQWALPQWPRAPPVPPPPQAACSRRSPWAWGQRASCASRRTPRATGGGGSLAWASSSATTRTCWRT